MFAIVSMLLSYLSPLFRPKQQLALEVLALRHTITVLKRQRLQELKHAHCGADDLGF